MADFIHKHGEWMRWLLPIGVASVMAYSYAMKVPELEERTQNLEKGQAVLETKVDYIVDGVKEIKSALRRR
ncbi:MAG: hypothetical protein WC713_00895 [Candidatus Methylomirabilota bacterium]|jgi:exonuclease VII small subunit